ncbi:phosphoribosyltransferase domain-containing protein [Agitococcus lubricus]|uniref:Phosphoribosyltransferase-like predicted ribonucleoside biosynthesis protein n=1 Tax=Agitococcus lubricus TaxID=1077255 RepID=A0A2T5J2K6_9GAMM|nr:phosphoribosyltransferase domain-containing protein [Agitococcus lubricus]PTQ90751.1 phosphoribosyltransferase-like predicted ribonucleoside biosynthesis protein [Agitococcus lubricus]
MTSSFAVHLQRGTLSVQVEQAAIAPEQLFGFAERRNPKRAFLFVSKVLGRHIPVKPSVMTDAFTQLAAKIPDNLPEPILVIGMAETAVGLGAGVHRALQTRYPQAMYWMSTRHSLGTPLFARFEEEHSHASSHLLHWPVDEALKQQLLATKTLIIVDDEASTGKTFINLAHALQDTGLQQIERIIATTLTDWSGDAVQATLGKKAQTVSLLSGTYCWQDNPNAPLPDMPKVDSVAQGQWQPNLALDWGRLGVIHHHATLNDKVSANKGEKILVLGTSEYVWRPFLLAEQLEQQGAEVYFASTTRSPIALGHAIHISRAFSDNYGLGIANFSYNVDVNQYDRIIICTETPATMIDKTLLTALNAQVIVDD